MSLMLRPQFSATEGTFYPRHTWCHTGPGRVQSLVQESQLVNSGRLVRTKSLSPGPWFCSGPHAHHLVLGHTWFPTAH